MPEIQRTNLGNVVLLLKSLGRSRKRFNDSLAVLNKRFGLIPLELMAPVFANCSTLLPGGSRH